MFMYWDYSAFVIWEYPFVEHFDKQIYQQQKKN